MQSSDNSTPNPSAFAPPQLPAPPQIPVPQLPPVAIPQTPAPVIPPLRSPVAEIPQALPPDMDDPTAPKKRRSRKKAPEAPTPDGEQSAEPAKKKSRNEGVETATIALKAFSNRIESLTSSLSKLADAATTAATSARQQANETKEQTRNDKAQRAAAGSGVMGAVGRGLGSLLGMGADGGSTDVLNFISRVPGAESRFAGLRVVAGFEGLRQQVELPSLQLSRLARAGGTPTQMLSTLAGEQFSQIGIAPGEQAQILTQAASAMGGGLTQRNAAYAASLMGAGEDVGAYFSNIGRMRQRGISSGFDVSGNVVRGLGLRGAAGASLQSQMVSSFLAQRSMGLGPVDQRAFYGRALQLGRGDFEVGVRAYERGQDISQRAERGLLAPFEGLAESALKARALQESGGDLVKATERMREIRRQGVPELYKTVASFYGTYRAKAALMAEGYTTEQIEVMQEPPATAQEAGVGPLGSTSYTMARAKREQARLAKSERFAGQFDTLMQAETRVEDIQLRRMQERFPTQGSLDVELNKTVGAVEKFVSQMDKIDEKLSETLLKSIDDLATAVLKMTTGTASFLDLIKGVQGGAIAVGLKELRDYINGFKR